MGSALVIPIAQPGFVMQQAFVSYGNGKSAHCPISAQLDAATMSVVDALKNSRQEQPVLPILIVPQTIAGMDSVSPQILGILVLTTVQSISVHTIV